MPKDQKTQLQKLKDNIDALIADNPIKYSPNIFRHKSGGISYSDTTGQTTQIIKDIVKMLLKSLIGGGISLPIRIYEPRSFLERVTDTWLDYSKPFTKASQLKNPKDRFSKVLSGILSGFSYAFLKQKQAFNPVLGETAQVTLPCGLKCFMEQVSHHPPITRFEAWDSLKKFKMHGDVTLDYKLGVTSISGQQSGKTYIDLFLDNNENNDEKENLEEMNIKEKEKEKGKTVEKYWYTLPGIKIDGLDKRHCYFSGKLVLNSKDFELDLHMNPSHSIVAKVLGNFVDAKTVTKLAGIKDFACGMMRDNTRGEKVMYPVFGCWLDKMYLGVKKIWEVDRDVEKYGDDKFGEDFEKEEDRILPSDSQNRIDILELRKKDYSKAQENKYIIEKVQRIEAKLRKR